MASTGGAVVSPVWFAPTPFTAYSFEALTFLQRASFSQHLCVTRSEILRLDAIYSDPSATASLDRNAIRVLTAFQIFWTRIDRA